MPVHDVAARGFGADALAYERTRPSYPPDVVAWITEQSGVGPGRTVCDLAAGTGKFTRLLVPTGARVIAVEPVAAMRTVLRKELPDTAVVAAIAEQLPFADASLDAISAAQAFHWFDTLVALAECFRTLRPGGHLAMVWNVWDDRQGWLRELRDVVADAGASPQWRRGHLSRAWLREALATQGGFTDPAHYESVNAQPMSPEAVMARVATTSHIAAKAPPERQVVLDALRQVIDTHPETRGRAVLEFRYLVDAYTCARR
jgi:SAM-dependent methyltransferase